MISQVYSVYDVVGQVFGQPFVSANRGTALRSFGNLVRDPNSIVGKSPNDFMLYLLSSFDDVTGVLEPVEKPMIVAHASSFLESKE